MKMHRAVFGTLAVCLLLSCVACVPMRQRVNNGPPGGAQGAAAPTPKAGKPSASVVSPAHGAGDWRNELEGLASWYGADFNGRLTASGEVYDMYAMTAAHKTLPLGTVVRVRNLENGKKTKVRINDRGPYVEGRVIDLSRKAARALGMRDNGTARVKIEVLKMP
jgi:rare lipoprotein A